MRAPRYLLLAGVLTAAALLAAPAQRRPPARGAPATLVGTAVDSINGGPLAHATILIDGVALSTESDSAGRFRIDSVAPGTWRLAIFHPLLDTLGLTLVSQPLRFEAGDTNEVVVATPSLRTLADEWCTPESRRLGPGVILGRVLVAETSEPVTDGRASLVWQETEAVPGVGLRRAQRVRSSTTGVEGRFALCGLPTTLRGVLQAERPGARTGELPVALAGREGIVQTLLVGVSPLALATSSDADSATPQGPRLRGSASLRGRVTDPEGRPIADASVVVEGTGAGAKTDATGAYVLAELPPGSWAVTARRVGARPAQAVVNLLPRRRSELSFMLAAASPELARVVVRDSLAEGLERVGFTSRKASGMGRYLTAEQIERRQPIRTTDLFVTMPDVRVVPNRRGGYSLRSARDGGRGCLVVFIDGMQWIEGVAGDLDTQVPWDQVAAIEVYTSAMRPLEFTGPGGSACGAVVFWTKLRVGGVR